MKKKPTTALHFLVLQHGYHGTERDFHYLSTLLRENKSRYIILEPTVNAGLRTEQGVLTCSQRLTDYLIGAIDSAVRGDESRKVADAAPTSTTATATLDGKRVACEVHLNFITHSMGGLIVRAALPGLADTLDQRYTDVHYDTFCAVSGPHVGVRQMPSSVRRWFGEWSGRLLRSPALLDLYLRTNVATSLLLEDAYLAAWRRFDSRVLIAVANDNTVMAYSSIFMVLPEDAVLLRERGETVKRNASTSEHTTIAPKTTGKEDTLEKDSEEAIPVATHHRAGLQAQLARQIASTAITTTAREDVEPNRSTPASSALYHAKAVLSPQLWPTDILPRERAMAERIISAVGPFEVYLVDFRPLVDSPAATTAATDTTAPTVSTWTAVDGEEHTKGTDRRGGDVGMQEEGEGGVYHRDPHAQPLVPVPAMAVTAISGRVGGGGHYGAYSMPHRAIICKPPCADPRMFGFVSAFIAEDLMGVPLSRQARQQHQQQPGTGDERTEPLAEGKAVPEPAPA